MTLNPALRRVLATGAMLACAAAVQAQPADAKKPAQPTSGYSEIRQAMMKGMHEAERMSSTGDVDRDFATMMKMHHQSGIDMAVAHLKHGNDANMRNMAEKMIKEQRAEIKELDEWLAADKAKGRSADKGDKGEKGDKGDKGERRRGK